MPYKLIPPGKRKGNRFYLIRGTVAGQRFEIATGTSDEKEAERAAPGLVAAVLDVGAQRNIDPQTLTFTQAATLYKEFRQPSKNDQRYIDRIVAQIDHKGTRLAATIRQADLVTAANTLHPGESNQTRNRQVIAPAAAILHYAAKNEWIGYRKFERFREPKPKTRSVGDEVPRVLLGNTKGKQRLLILWLFRQGSRITDTVRVEWPQINLEAATVEMLVSKKRGGAEWRTFSLDDDLVAALANEDKAQPLWPWVTRAGVYKWLIPLVRRLGITFTPHMARHTRGRYLNATGAGLRTIMQALGQDDPKSAIRYTDADIEVVRAAQRKAIGAGERRGKKK